jgi:ubiquinone/menaquinone biosynthesis C-methylase UbiE
MPANPERRYLPAASFDFLLPVYDPIMRLLGFSAALGPLVAQAELRLGHSVLEVGCGTGTLALLILQHHRGVSVIGVDPDPKALARAEQKARRAGVAIRFERGFGDALAHADASFDRVFSSMMFHHVPKDEKPLVLAEIRRVLKPGGRLELLDFTDARMLQRMQEAGFAQARLVGARRTVSRTISYYQATA